MRVGELVAVALRLDVLALGDGLQASLVIGTGGCCSPHQKLWRRIREQEEEEEEGPGGTSRKEERK